MKAIFRFISLLALLLPNFLSAQNNLAVNFSDGFIGTRGNNSQDANNILNFSTLGISYAQFYQSDSDGDGLFSVQGNDIPGRIKIVLDDGTVIDYAASVTWRDSNNNYVFGVLFSSSDDPAINFNSIVYNTGTLQLYSGNIKNVSSNLGLIVSGTGFSIADGSSINGNAATNGVLNALNSYYSSSVSSDSTNPTISDQTFSYNENTSSGTEIGNVLANDNVGVSSYNILAGNVDGYFAIDNSGSISLTTTGASSAANDFETSPNSYSITVEVTDANSNTSSATITLNVLDVVAEPGFTIASSTDPLVVAESGTTATFTVVLDAQPSSNVVLSVTSSDTGEATVSPSTLTFTSANWNTTQTVTVTGVDDTLIDGTIGSTTTVSVVDASSDDDFDGLSDQTVSVSTTDDDSAGFTIASSTDPLVVAESGTTATFTVVLDAQPSSNVVLSVTSSDTGEATVSPSTLTFTSANWNTTQTVTVTGVDDTLIDGTIGSTTTVSVVDASSDDDFDGLSDQTVSVSTTDDDSAGFTIASSTDPLVVAESGTTATFTVVLDAQPSSNVVLSVTSSDTGEATVSPSTLTFTSANWNTTQTVTVTGVDDTLIDGTIGSTTTVSVVDASSDDDFDGLSDQTVSVSTTDDDSTDDDAPVITDATGDLALGTGDSYVGDTAGVSATDNVDGDVTADIVVTGDTVDTDVPGTYTITYNVTDSAGNAATAVTRTVIVTDDDAPVITDATGDLALGTGDSYVGDTAGVSATDNVDGDVTADIVVTGDTVDTDVPGTYTITYNVTDSAGNAATAVTRTVIVTDDDAPVITDATGDLALGTGDSYVGDTAGVSATDNVDGDVTADIVVTGDTVDTDVPGTYTITYNVTDSAGNAATAVTRTVIVTDDDAPVITDATGDLALGTGDSYVGDTAGVSATDNVDGDVTADIVVTGDTVDTDVPGTYTITYNVTDSAGNAATAVTRTVIVTDDDAPVITDATGDLALGTGDSYVGDTAGVSATDNVDGDVTADIVVTGDTVDTDVPGTYTITYNVTDSAGNAATAVTRTVIVTDDDAPVITDATGDLALGTGDSYVGDTAGVSATDNVDGDVTADIVVTGDTVDTDVPGTYTITYNVTDSAGNAATAVTRTVIVTDDDAPVITDATGDLALGTGDSYVGDTAGVSATDNVDGDVTADIVVTGDTVDTDVPGTYTITYNVTDSAGNAATAVTRTVIVTDDDAPVITDATGDLALGTGDSYVGDTAGVSATDNVDGDVTADIVVTGDTVDTDVPGTYTITYNVTDSAGNAATAVTRTVIVTDDDAPVITDATGDLALGTGDSYVGDTAGVSATDNVDGDVTADIVVTGDTVDTDVPGTYTITYNVTDSAGNAATAVTRTVIVTDDDAPVITDATGDLALGTGDSYVGDTAGVSATDNVDGDVTADIVVTGDTVDTDVPGTYTITYNVTDSAGNAATAVTRTVIVTDDDAPVITKGQSFSYTENQETDYVVGNILATDNIKVDKLILKSVFGFDESDYTSDGLFALNASTGVLSLTAEGSSGAANDYETTPNSYSLTIEATDTTGNSSTETVLVAITDVDDTAPVLDGLFDEVNESGVYIYQDLTLEGTLDTYEFVSNEDATWSLSGDDAESFVLIDETEAVKINYATNNLDTPTNTISSKRVKLRFKVAPDYENPIDINFDNVYDLFVNVTDAYNNTSQIETEITVIPDADGDGVTDEEDPDDDNDGVEDIYDFCPGTQPGTPVDVNGCDLLIIASEEFRVSATSATCSNTNDGEIQVTALNENYNYEVRLTGSNGVINLNTTEGYSSSITGLSKGTYQVCFTVVGDDIFEQCFTVFIDQPDELQVVSTYLEDKQALDLQIDGATEYFIELNGVLQSRRGSRISLALQKGMNLVKIYTDVECQGVIEEEIFVSEKLEYAPNPVEDVLNLYVGGVDSTVKLTITDLNGVQIESREVRVPTSRVYSMNMSRYPEGIYILTAEGVTIRKSIKIIKR